ncbi:MAG: hypothetical protein ACXW0L_04895 [Methylosarcina sp.]
MESNHTTNTSDLLFRLTRLEEQVTTLSSQLESDKITISQLKQSLSDRDLRISELESKLIIAQNSLLKTTFDKIYQCREQIKSGIDVKIVAPALTQIQKYIQAMESLIAEARDLIGRKKIFLNEGISISSNLVRQSPNQVRLILEKNIIEPVKAIVEKSVQYSRIIYRMCRDWVEQELINRYERIAFSVRDMLLKTHIILQMRLLEPARAQVDHLPALAQSIKNATVSRVNRSLIQIRQLSRQGFEFIDEQIKKSSFWDGKQRMKPAM